MVRIERQDPRADVLFYKKGMVKNGATPVWMTSYGGFDVNLTPSFYPPAVAWADAGGILAQPNIRGGGEFGESWHQAGMMEKKQNVFDDFIAAGEWLIANHYTNSSKLAIEGGSNGGLLVGASLRSGPTCSARSFAISAARYAAFSEIYEGLVLGAGVRLGGRSGAVQILAEIFAVPECEGWHCVSGGAVHHR